MTPKMNKATTAKSKPSADELKTIKGTRDIIGQDFFWYQGFFEKAAEIALYYGFQPIETPIMEKESLFVRGVGSGTDIVDKEIYSLKTKGGDRLALRPEGTASIMRAYFEHGMQSLPQPVMLFYYGPFFRHENPQRNRWRQFYSFGFEVLGTKKSIADATVIKLTTSILEEVGIKDIVVKINSTGDSDCRSAYRRELVNYYRKHSRQICADCRQRLKTNPLRVLDCKNIKCQDIKAGAPESISYLCTGCKQHFKEVLEYLGSMDITYEIDSSLVRGLDYYSRTVFEIFPSNDDLETDEIPSAIAGGGRYDGLSKFLGARKEVPAVGAGIGVDRVLNLKNYSKPTPRLLKKPKVFFIQLSFDAKLKSFTVIEILRKAKISIAQSLSKDSLSAQLAIAEKMKVPFTIILGQKEALDDTVIVRNMDNRSQDTVPINQLADYIKKIK